MGTATNLIRHEVLLTIGGKKDTEVSTRLIEMEVDTMLGAASMFMLRFHDNEGMLVADTSQFDLGNVVKIEAKGSYSSKKTTVIEGEITSIEPRFSMDGKELVVRGYDKRHRLTRGTKKRVFVDQTISGIVQKIASENNLSASVDSTSPAYDHVFQDNLSDYDFIHKLARLVGFQVGFDGKALQFKKVNQGETIEVDFGQQLREFRPRMNVAGIPSEVMVTGWDPVTVKAIIGKKATSSVQATIGDGSNGISDSKSLFGAVTASYYIPTIKDQSDADKIAQSLLDYFNSRFIEAEGIVYGLQTVVAGVKLKVSEVGTRFNGTYTVSAAQHRYFGGTYEVHFRCEGAKASLLSDMIGSGNQEHGWNGVVPAIVTNINEKESNTSEMVSVKVKFPWMADDLEGHWARVSGIGGHKSSGIHWIPDINDEVLVAFENGDFNRPYVVGALWNGKTTAPAQNAVAQKNGKVIVRTIQTPAGHIIRLTDEAGKEKIEIVDAKGGTSITIDAANKSTTIKSGGDISLDAGGKIILSAKGNIEVGSSAQLKLEGKTGGELDGGPTLTVKGTKVNIN